MKKKPTSLIKSSLMSFKSRLLAVYQSEETIYVGWEDVFLAGTLEESRVVAVAALSGATHWRSQDLDIPP